MKHKALFVWASLFLMGFAGLMLWQRSATASTAHKILLIAPIALASVIASVKALIEKTDPATRVAYVANMGTFAAFFVIRIMTAHT